MTKQVFSRVFKEAWIDTVKMKTNVNSFSASGIFPVDVSRVLGPKVMPSKLYDNSGSSTVILVQIWLFMSWRQN